MKWSLVFKKLITGFITGGIASVSESVANRSAPIGPEEAVQHTVVGAIVGILNALTNWYKHRND